MNEEHTGTRWVFRCYEPTNKQRWRYKMYRRYNGMTPYEARYLLLQLNQHHGRDY